MASIAAKMVKQYFASLQPPLRVGEMGENQLRLGLQLKNTKIDVFMKFNETDTQVQAIGLNFIKVPQDKMDVIYKALNECNRKFVHVKFFVDEQTGQVVVQGDDWIQQDSCGAPCLRLIQLMANIVDQAYPIIMKALWA